MALKSALELTILILIFKKFPGEGPRTPPSSGGYSIPPSICGGPIFGFGRGPHIEPDRPWQPSPESIAKQSVKLTNFRGQKEDKG